MAMTPNTFTEDDKEEMQDSVVWYTPTSDIGRKQLGALIKVLQEIIKHKQDQVDSLMGALDELASKQGEEVARGRQELLDEIDELREQLEYHRRMDQGTDLSDDQLRNELVRLEMQNEELVQELQEREKDLTTEKAEVERLVAEVARLEREKLDVVRELTALQEETNERIGRSVTDSPDNGPEKIEELMELVRQKNKHIFQLLDDIEAVEHDNQENKVKLANMRDQIKESSNEITHLRSQVATLQISIDDGERKIEELTDHNNALVSQISEMADKKAKHDKDLDEFAITLNSRVEEWKRLLDLKDIEIMTVREELDKYLSTSTPWAEITSDTEVKTRLMQQEKEIIKLKTELAEALRESNRNLELIEEFKSKLSNLENTSDLNLKITTLEAKVSALKEQLKLAEEDSTCKAEEITKLVIQLRAYEREEYGLSDAIEQIKKLEKRLIDREAKLEKMIETCNKLGMEKGSLEDENLYLREKLGLSPSHVVDSLSVRKKSESDAQAVVDLKIELEKIRDEMVELKIQNREMALKLRSQSHDVKFIDEVKPQENKHPDMELLEKKYEHVVEENDALRKGMHEILKNIQTQTMGDIQISSLERLLEALDARHISGWYHPAMRLQAQLNAINGECRELRSQIRTLADDKAEINDELEASRELIQSLKNKLQEGTIPLIIESTGEGENKCLTEKLAAERKCIELENIISKLNFEAERSLSGWEVEKRELQIERDDLLVKLANFKNKVDEEDTLELNINGLKQAVQFLKLREATFEAEITDLRRTFLIKEERSLEIVAALQKEKAMLLLRIHDLETSLLSFEPADEVAQLKRQIAALRLGFNAAVSANAQSLAEPTIINGDIPVLNNEWENMEKRELLDELRAVKEKLYEAECLLNSSEGSQVSSQLSILASKLSAAEVREKSEKQKNTYLEKCNEILKTELSQLQVLVKEVSQQLKVETEMNENLQKALAETENKIWKEICEEPVKLITELENKLEKCSIEKNNLAELLEISRTQCKGMQSLLQAGNIDREAYAECLLLLQSSQGEKLAVLKLNHEIVTAKKLNLELDARNIQLNNKVTHLTAENIAKDAKLSESSTVIKRLNEKNVSIAKFFFKLINRIHHAYDKAFMFPSISRANKILKEIHEKNNSLKEKQIALEDKEQELQIKNDEFIVQLEALQDLKDSFQSHNKNLINWHNKTTELRLRETRLQRNNEHLSKELIRMEESGKTMAKEIFHLEEKLISKEREWDEYQKLWELHNLDVLDAFESGTWNKHLPKEEKGKLESDKTQHVEAVLLQNRIVTLEDENDQLKKAITDNNEAFKSELVKVSKIRNLELVEATEREKGERFLIEMQENKCEHDVDREVVALQITVNSLQSIVKQKEDTATRYQELLKKTREEHSSSMRRLQNELKNVHNALAMQSKAYSRLKHGVYQPGIVEIEKYINKVQELEEELSESKSTSSRTNEMLKSSLQDCAKWKEIAEERTVVLEETRERLEIELERCREEMQNQEVEIQHLQEIAQEGQTEELLETIRNLQSKLSQLERSRRPQSSRRVKTEDEEINDGALKRQLKASRDECNRLRDQVTTLKQLKRRISSAKSSQGQENLVDKIRKLEEMLHLSKQHEQQLEEQGLKKIRSIEEVTRWDERKRHQKTIEKLENKLKQKEVEISVALNKVETMRGLLAKMDREKSALEVQLRSLSESARKNTQMEQLLEEKTQLAAQVAELEEEITNLQRHEGGKAAAMMHAKLEAQERKIASLQLADQAPVALAAELERLQGANVALGRANLQLESDNLNLKLSLEKVRMENQALRSSIRRLEEERRSRAQSPAVRSAPSRAQTRMAYENQREVNKLKIEIKTIRERLSATMDRNVELEEEIQRLSKQLALWEEKDLADSLAKSNQQQMVADLHQELVQVKAQLSHKIHLLDRVKILLSKAASKEKALSEKVAVLQTMVSEQSSLI